MLVETVLVCLEIWIEVQGWIVIVRRGGIMVNLRWKTQSRISVVCILVIIVMYRR